MKIIERIVQDSGEPNKNDLWLKVSNDGGETSTELLVNLGGEWKSVNSALATILEGIVEEVEKIKEYSAGLGISISEQGEISNELVVGVGNIKNRDLISDELMGKLRRATAIKTEEGFLPVASERSFAQVLETTVYRAFGHANCDEENIVDGAHGWAVTNSSDGWKWSFVEI